MEEVNMAVGKTSIVQRLVKKTGFLPIVILVMALFTQINNPTFFTLDNITNVIRQISVNGVLAIATTLVILTGNIDLSLGSIIGLSSCIGCSVVLNTGHVILGMVTALVLGAVCGAVNGFIVVRSEIHPFVVTLGTGMVYSGLAYILTGGAQVAGLPASFLVIGSGSFWGIPYLFLLMVVSFLLISFVLNKTRFGLRLYEIGGKEEAVVASGINAQLYKIAAYAFEGALVGIAGMMLASRTISGHASLGSGYHFQAIGAAVIGGVSLNGGRGKASGVLCGVLITGILNNSLNLMKVSSFWQDAAIGVVIVLAVIIDTFRAAQERK